MSQLQIRLQGGGRAGTVTFDIVGDVELSGGAGGWSELTRPRRRTAIEYTGTPSVTQTLPLSLDGLDAYGPGSHRSVEADCATVESWSDPQRGTGEPGALIVDGPAHHTDLRWVVGDITWGPLIRDDRRQRIRQDLTLVLLELVTPRIVKSAAKRGRARSRNGKGGKGGFQQGTGGFQASRT